MHSHRPDDQLQQFDMQRTTQYYRMPLNPSAGIQSMAGVPTSSSLMTTGSMSNMMNTKQMVNMSTGPRPPGLRMPNRMHAPNGPEQGEWLHFIVFL